MKYILKGFIYLLIFLFAVSSASAYTPDEDHGIAVYMLNNDIIYCNNADCYLTTSIDAFEMCVNTHEANESSCTKTTFPLEFTKSCEDDSILCSLFVSDNWEDWFYFGFENLGKKPKVAKISFILVHATYLDSGADTDPTIEKLLTSLLDIDLSASGVNRLHAFTLAFYLAGRNSSEDTILVDINNTFRASIKSAPRILADVFDDIVSFVEMFFEQTPTDASAEVTTLVRTFILDIFPNATSAEALIPKSLIVSYNEQT
jgi:hypothetical protein